MIAVLFLFPLLFAFSTGGAFPKPLSKEEEKKYLIQYKEGNEEEKKEAKDQLLLHNLRLVAHIVKKYNNPLYREQEELLSIGIIGLIKAIHSYDMEKSIRLATYASRCIENEILMALRANKKTQNNISIQEPIGTDRDGNEIVLLDIIYSDIPDFADTISFGVESKKMLEAVQHVLTKRERTVVILRFGLGNQDVYTQQEIAQLLGISRSYVSRIEKKALKKLKEALEA